MASNFKTKTGYSCCKREQCGKEFKLLNVRRSLGEDSPAYIGGFCSAYCYTQAVVSRATWALNDDAAKRMFHEQTYPNHPGVWLSTSIDEGDKEEYLEWYERHGMANRYVQKRIVGILGTRIGLNEQAGIAPSTANIESSPLLSTDDQKFILEAFADRDKFITAEADKKDLLYALTDLWADISGGKKSCGHEYPCICAGDKTRSVLAKYSTNI